MAEERIKGEKESISQQPLSQQKKEKRESIMNAALKVFAKKGYSPAALDEVANEAGIGKGTIYLYFSDKEDLFCSTMIYVMDKMRNFLEEGLKGETHPLRLLKNVIYLLLEFFSMNTSFFSLIEVAINENIMSIHKKLKDNMIERRRELYEFLGSVYDRGVKMNIVRDDIPRDSFITSIDGVVMGEIRRIIFENIERKKPIKVDISERADAVFKIITEGILKK